MESTLTAITRRIGVYLLSTLLMFHTISCSYFKVKTVTSDFTTTIKEIGEIHNYFVIHSGDRSFHLSEIGLDSTNISGLVGPLNYMVHYAEGRTTRIKRGESSILNEVHIYLREGADAIEAGYTSLPLRDIRELRIIDKDNGTTIASHVFGGAAIVAGTLAIVGIIAFLTKSSCPYVYVNNGETFAFAGETYGGAIGENLERDDYLPLPGIKPIDDTYQIRITNELKERQYTDLAKLIAVNHHPDQKILLDKGGAVQVIDNPQAPTEARSFGDTKLVSSLASVDHEKYFFNDSEYSLNGIVLKFKKPTRAQTGKLLLEAKNTLWFDYVFGEFLQNFGGYFNSAMKRNSKIPAAERLQTVRDNNFPLSIYAKQNGQWQLVDYLLTVGPLASREFAVPLDLTQYPGDEIEIKLETGFMFWEVDRVAMDFSTPATPEVTHLDPISALGNHGENWADALREVDGISMAQEKVRDVTELIFPVPPVPEDQVQSVFLLTRGYYELIRDFKGLPDLAELRKFRDPTYFSEYSRAGYLKVLNREEEIEAMKMVVK
jgi:hypothetical protein